MKEHHKQKTITTLLIVLLVIFAVNQYMLVTISSVPRLAVLQEVSQPEVSQVGIPYNEQGYQQLLNYDKTIQLSNAQKQEYVGLNVEMPCCGFQTLQAAGNCECGHHLALSGLAKYMIQNNYSKAQVQAEIGNWKKVFYPDSGGSGSPGGC